MKETARYDGTVKESRSVDEMEEFKYKPLDRTTREIRLLRFVNMPHDNRPIEIELIHRSLQDPGEYSPLSYNWGNAADQEVIIVNDSIRKVPKSLVSLLRAVWKAFPDGEESDLWWADAICINQDDSEEKSHQVQMMGSIYQSGGITFGYLGPSEDDHLVLELLHAIGDIWAVECRKALGVRWLNRNPHPNFGNWMRKYPKFWERNCAGEVPNKYWYAFRKFLELPYWSRIWIFQEIILSRNFGLLYGKSAILFMTLMYTGAWLQEIRKHQWAVFGGLIDPFLWKCFISGSIFKLTVTERLRYGLALHWDKQETIDLRLVYICYDLLATDPRDKIFGLLGLMQTKLTADYTKSARDVYCSFVQAWESEMDDLSILTLAGLNFRLKDWPGLRLPSWVPNWIDYAQPNRQGPLNLFIGPNEGHQASLGFPKRTVRYSDPWSSLFVSGIVCDTVDELIPEWPVPGHEDDLLQWIENFKLKEKVYTKTGIPFLQIIFRTVFLNKHLGIGLLDINEEKTHSLAMAFLCALLKKQIDTHGLKKALEEHLPLLGLDPGSEFGVSYQQNVFPNAKAIPQLPQWLNAQIALQFRENNVMETALPVSKQIMSLQHRRLFVTKSGYIGLAIATEKEDLVAVIAGCNVPVLLRREESYYVLIGVCFVLGLMEGEAGEIAARDETKIQELEIR
jgi:heterokaryon incompatibility protein (HET)